MRSSLQTRLTSKIPAPTPHPHLPISGLSTATPRPAHAYSCPARLPGVSFRSSSLVPKIFPVPVRRPDSHCLGSVVGSQLTISCGGPKTFLGAKERSSHLVFLLLNEPTIVDRVSCFQGNSRIWGGVEMGGGGGGEGGKWLHETLRKEKQVT